METTSVWKMTIKPHPEEGREPFEWCRKRGIVGVGWSYAYEGCSSVPKNPLRRLKRREKGRVPQPVKRLSEEVSTGDFVWLQYKGKYFLCRVKKGEMLYGPEIGRSFLANDIGHARKVAWAEIREDLVPGIVQRALIVQRMLQRIRCSRSEIGMFRVLHRESKKKPGWKPAFNPSRMSRQIKSMNLRAFNAQMTPDDWEDLVALWLQSRGWMLIKSSCFRSKPRFEFRMVRAGSSARTAYIQVKTGARQLRPLEYEEDVGPETIVYLLSTAPEPYPGESVRGVKTLKPSELKTWVSNHPDLIPSTLGLRLSIA
ncbi:MAG: hypothetical protein O7H41_21570 [Planctomycetota bacterium]|nr:hypothetical protein [Planctomycetota bacterium]